MKTLELRTSLFRFDPTQLGRAYRVVIESITSMLGKRSKDWQRSRTQACLSSL